MGKGFRDKGGCQVCIEMSMVSFYGFSLICPINMDMACISVSITTNSLFFRIFFCNFILFYFLLCIYLFVLV
jgi:hypothetical protein